MTASNATATSAADALLARFQILMVDEIHPPCVRAENFHRGEVFVTAEGHHIVAGAEAAERIPLRRRIRVLGRATTEHGDDGRARMREQQIRGPERGVVEVRRTHDDPLEAPFGHDTPRHFSSHPRTLRVAFATRPVVRHAGNVGEGLPTSAHAEWFRDPRSLDRRMRASWHPEAGVVVLSLWADQTCAATFRLSLDDVPAFAHLLVDALAEAPAPAPEPVETAHRSLAAVLRQRLHRRPIAPVVPLRDPE